jgi:hypothetical protein
MWKLKPHKRFGYDFVIGGTFGVRRLSRFPSDFQQRHYAMFSPEGYQAVALQRLRQSTDLM